MIGWLVLISSVGNGIERSLRVIGIGKRWSGGFEINKEKKRGKKLFFLFFGFCFKVGFFWFWIWWVIYLFIYWLEIYLAFIIC